MQVTGHLPKRCQAENECQGACDTVATSPSLLPFPSPSPVTSFPSLLPHSTAAPRHTSQSQYVNMPPRPSYHLIPKSPERHAASAPPPHPPKIPARIITAMPNAARATRRNTLNANKSQVTTSRSDNTPPPAWQAPTP